MTECGVLESIEKTRRKIRKSAGGLKGFFSGIQVVFVEKRALFAPEPIGETAFGEFNIGKRNRLVDFHVAKQAAAFGETGRQKIFFAGDRAFFSLSVNGESADSIDFFSRFHRSFCERNHFDQRSAERRHYRILKIDDSGDRIGNFEKTEMIRRVKTVERTVAEFVVS